MLQDSDTEISREVMLSFSYQGSIPKGVLPFLKKIGLLGMTTLLSLPPGATTLLQADQAASLDDLRALCQAAQDAVLAYEARTREQLGAEETVLLQHPAAEPAPAWLGVLVAAYKAKQSEVVMRVGASSAAAAMTAAAPAVVAGAPPPSLHLLNYEPHNEGEAHSESS